MPEMIEKIGLSKAIIHRMVKERRDGFPLSRRLTSTKLGWIESKVDEWILSRETAY